MKTFIKHLSLLPMLIAGLAFILPGQATAQTFTNLHSFTALSGFPSTNSDGSFPDAGLVLSGDILYGTTYQGGTSSVGTLFAVNVNGTSFTVVHSFTALSNATNSDGANPKAGLILSGNTLYGTAAFGGSSGNGTVFALHTDGTGFTNLYSFTGGSDGGLPSAGLILSGSTLYGTAQFGGSSGHGTVFKVNTNGTGFTTLHTFTAYPGFSSTNSDGASPRAGLILSGNSLYGTAAFGGSSGNGAVFKVSTNGMGFTNLHSFTATSASFPYSNSDGARPEGGLILSGDTLYGTAYGGGSSGYGALFAVNTNGTGFTNLHSFTYFDGANPYAGVILSGNTLYGTASSGDSSGYGTVFAVNTNGTGFTNLHSFASNDGRLPSAELILSDNTLHGTALNGGSSGNGTVFSILLPVPPNQRPIVANPILDHSGIYGSAFTFTFGADTFSDPDAGQVLSYTAGGMPPGLTFIGATRTFSGTPTNPGPYTITVTATDNGTLPLSTNDTFNIVVAKAPLTVTANSTNRPHGQPNPSLTGTLVGVTNSDNITATFSTTATPASPPGNYPITPTLLDPGAKLGNYDVTTNLGVFTVLTNNSIFRPFRPHGNVAW